MIKTFVLLVELTVENDGEGYINLLYPDEIKRDFILPDKVDGTAD